MSKRAFVIGAAVLCACTARSNGATDAGVDAATTGDSTMIGADASSQPGESDAGGDAGDAGISPAGDAGDAGISPAGDAGDGGASGGDASFAPALDGGLCVGASFASEATYPSGDNLQNEASYAVSVAVADLNGDGHPDLAVANRSENTISLRLNHGDGTFDPQVLIPSADGPQSIAAADLNGDGHLDLAVVNINSVSALMNEGSSTFAAPVSYRIPGQPEAVVIADFNKDGHPDLAVTNGLVNVGTVDVLLNQGDGSFAAPIVYAAGNMPNAIVAADFNGDGFPDIAVANLALINPSGPPGPPSMIPGSVSVFLNHGDGTFAPQVALQTGRMPFGLVAGDFNGDGHPDLAVTNMPDSTVGLFVNQGDGTFSPQETFDVSGDTLTAGDFNGDGLIDLAVANHGTLSVLPNAGHGTFSAPVTFSIGPNPGEVTVADVNGDSRPDIVLTDLYASTVGILQNECGSPGGEAPDGGMPDAGSGDACRIPPGANTTTDGGIGCAPTSGVADPSLGACNASQYTYECTADRDAGVFPEPASALGCSVLPIPTPVNVAVFCCPCE